MGRGQKRSWGGGGGRGGGRGGNNWRQDKKPKKDFLGRDDMSNGAFEEYYRAQDIVPADEWVPFLATLRRPLPVTFRINGSGKFADHLRDKLKSDFFAQLGSGEVTIDGEPLAPPVQLPWYPNGYAWQLVFSRNQLRKSPLLESIHEFVKHANEAGSISRQEAVSMVPPLFLDVQPHHRVLDMCAAPGSKTFQLLEALHAGSKTGQTPTGFVVANDTDFMRCNLLTHQTKRVCSPCLLVTNHDASLFPSVLFPPRPAQPAEAAAGEEGAAAAPDGEAQQQQPQQGGSGRIPKVPVRFDRILADVPCSGDGTLRKSPDIWRRWNVSGGNGLHPLQLRIAMHGAKLLEVGGRMVYSTCTFNPVEDEAVVAELLLRCEGALELLEVGDCLPELRRMKGKHHWKVKDKFRFYDSWEEARDVSFKLQETMFSNPAKAALPLERCMRFLPHHGDTGGFFVAVLRKVAELPAHLLDTSGRLRERKEEAEEEGAAAADGMGAEPAADDGMDAEAAAAAAEDGDAAGSDAEAEAGPAAEADGEQAGEGAQGAAATPAAGREEAAGPAGRAEAAAEVKAEVTPLDAARAQAEAAVAAAEAALQAFVAGKLEDATRAAGQAEAAAGRAAEVHQSQNRGAGQASGRQQRPDQRRQQQRQQQQQSKPAGDADGGQQAAAAGDGAAGEAEEAGPSTAVEVSWIRGGGGRGRPSGGKYSYIDPVAPVEDEAVLTSMYDYYGIAADFPLRSQLLMRSLDRQPKRLYFVARSVLDLMLADSREVLKIVSTGLKVFERQVVRDQVNECPYRLSQEGLPLVLPYITRQRLEVPPEVLLQLLRERNLILPEAAATEGETTAAGNPRGTKPTLTDERVLAALEPLKLGCVVCELAAEDARRLGFAASYRAAPAEARALAAASNGAGAAASGAEADAPAAAEGDEVTGGLAANAPLAVVGWKGKASLAIMVEKAECAQMIDKLEAELKKLST